MTTTEVSDSLERVDNIINMLDEIMDHMDGFSSAEEAWLSSITETLRTWRYVMHETYESPENNEDDQQLRSSGRRPYVHCGFIWTSRCSVIGPAVGRVSADRHRFAVVPVATNSFAALTGRPP